MDDAKKRFLNALVRHAAFDGWGAGAWASAVRELGLTDGEARLYFSENPHEQVQAWIALADQEMVAALAEKDLPTMKVRARITCAVRTRLEQAEAHREAVRRASVILFFPGGAVAKSLWRTADAMWRAAGDTATDFNYYSKRAILSTLYSAVLLFWLQDESDGRAETWAFLDRRIADVMRFEKVKADVRKIQCPSLVGFLGKLRYPAA